MPSFDHSSLLPLGSVLNTRSLPFEIRGVYGGRKKRYIVERDEAACSRECKEKPICFPTLGEIIKDCKCQKCPTGVPALDGNTCEENCPQGQEKNEKGGCCPTGQRPKLKGDGCEAKQDGNDKKGGCPGDTVLDPKEGWDPKTGDPKCQIDDEKDCPKPKIPETRPAGKENDISYKVKCGEPDKDETKRPKCDAKSQYVHVSVDSEGKATEICKQTKKYQDRKKGKPTNSDIRTKIKDQFNKLKPEYDKKDQERKDSLEKLKKLQEQRDQDMKERDEKTKGVNDKKKERLAKCDTSIALLLGAAFNEAQKSRRDEVEHPYDWTTDYFDEEFVGSDDRLQEWPQEADVNQISADVNTEAFLKKWDEYIDDHKRTGHSCNFIGKRSLDRRCSQKRTVGEWYGDSNMDNHSYDISSLIVREVRPVSVPELASRNIEELGKRNPFAFLFSILAQFGGRLAVSVTARATASVAANSPRLATLLKTPDRLFQIAKKGQGTKAGTKGMENAKLAIKKDYKRWLKCLKEGVP
ncbi:hypothetical protein BKA66DRAFT_614464 [Pyrenochaeta sp. MPI-SDFR-AT-0127]|nr:hypothetical protein BKA66DRAFT_614464 [Pyrenochaeta sp. MPI-SDFR-AT-0127]